MCDWSSTWSSRPPSLQAALWAHMQLEQHLGSIPSWAAVGWGLALRIRDNLEQQASLSAGTFLHGCYRVQHGQQLEQLRPESAGSIWRGAG